MMLLELWRGFVEIEIRTVAVDLEIAIYPRFDIFITENTSKLLKLNLTRVIE